MEDLTQRITRAAESVLENESLTDDLNDEAAQILIEWGIDNAKMIAADTEGLDDEAAEKAMYPRMRHMRRMMRTINNWAGHRADLDAASRRSALQKITKQAEIVYGDAHPLPDDAQQAAFLDQHPADTPTPQLITALRRFLENPPDPPDPPQADDADQLSLRARILSYYLPHDPDNDD